jgi:uncharacterized phage-like protein YoqJ
VSVPTICVAGTGHRPQHLGGFSPRILLRLTDLARVSLRHLDATEVVSGMALGWDTAIALAALELDLPLIAAVPFDGQERMWPAESQAQYRAILARAAEVVVVSSGGYAPWKMQTRNEWMVDCADKLLALWSGSAGGTKNCVEYAKKSGACVINVWQSWARYADATSETLEVAEDAGCTPGAQQQVLS